MVGSIISGIGSIVAGHQLSNAYGDAATNANSTLQTQYNQVGQNEAPYTGLGSTAAGQINSDLQNGTGFAKGFNMADFYSDPGYQFTLQQGTNAVNNSAAARGGLLSGAAAKSLDSYTTGLADQTYGDAYNRYLQTSNQQYNELLGVANLGQSATNAQNQLQTGISGQQASNTYNATVGAGAARASGTVGLTNSVNNGLSSLAQYYMAGA